MGTPICPAIFFRLNFKRCTHKILDFIVVQQESGQNQIALVTKGLALHLQNGKELAKRVKTSPATSEQTV